MDLPGTGRYGKLTSRGWARHAFFSSRFSFPFLSFFFFNVDQNIAHFYPRSLTIINKRKSYLEHAKELS